MLYRLLSKLLDYPDADLLDALPETRARLARNPDLDPTERRVVADFIDHLEALDPTEAQAAYVLTFDLTPEHALHLTHHLFGDDKNRGPALIDLTEFYKEYGLELAANELPDFLPLVLEFADQLDPEEARMFLAQWTKVLKVLAGNLEKADSPYAALVRLVENRAQLVKAAA
ncbi:MAG: nitrate reductase molybdenum cofactor assembly chaperone [Gallionellaceae bacterium]|nr:nitrate reductase molybdenum cofactor assembly chaperone [Gallionellaceae bacterium]